MLTLRTSLLDACCFGITFEFEMFQDVCVCVCVCVCLPLEMLVCLGHDRFRTVIHMVFCITRRVESKEKRRKLEIRKTTIGYVCQRLL